MAASENTWLTCEERHRGIEILAKTAKGKKAVLGRDGDFPAPG
jgi:hypothetical protein